MSKTLPRRDHVPRDGEVAHQSGYGPDACPWSSTEAPMEMRLWLARWYRADYTAFWSHVHGAMVPPSVAALEE